MPAASVLVGQELHSLGLWRRLVGDSVGRIESCVSAGSAMGSDAGDPPGTGVMSHQAVSGEEAAGDRAT